MSSLKITAYDGKSVETYRMEVLAKKVEQKYPGTYTRQRSRTPGKKEMLQLIEERTGRKQGTI